MCFVTFYLSSIYRKLYMLSISVWTPFGRSVAYIESKIRERATDDSRREYSGYVHVWNFVPYVWTLDRQYPFQRRNQVIVEHLVPDLSTMPQNQIHIVLLRNHTL